LLHGNTELLASLFFPSVSNVLKHFETNFYVLNEEKYLELEVNNIYLENIINELGVLLQPFKQGLSQTNFDSMLQIISRSISEFFETEIYKKKFNLKGAKHLSREFLSLVQYLSKQAKRSVSSKFLKLSDIIDILNLDQLNEFNILWESRNNWHLSPKEVKNILLQRTDFSKIAINKLGN